MLFEELKKIANNTVTLGRWFNIKNRFGSKDDLLPERFYNEPLLSEGSDGFKVDKKDYLREVQYYYSLRNWDENGIPRFTPEH